MFSVLDQIAMHKNGDPEEIKYRSGVAGSRRLKRIGKMETSPFCEVCDVEVNLDNSCLKQSRLLCIPCSRREHADKQIATGHSGKQPKLNRFGKLRNKWWNECPCCVYCERRIELFEATLDHRIPRAKGGTSCQDNLVLSCEICNQAKGNEDEDHFRKLILPKLKYLLDLQMAEISL